MQIRVTSHSIDVLDASVLTALSVVTDLEAVSAVRVLVDDGLAHPDGRGGDHAWLDIAELVRRAEPDSAPDWRSKFDAMIDYAASKGWTDAGRSVVRAHVEVDA
jgi:hypothetical protein